ncbi:MAG: alkaline phosphatase family protein [Planctomycetaceae bacterium]|nr:alkaline phosphatase family protein [Planctomycetaceae bacterium]
MKDSVSKKVLLVVIDALSDDVVQRALQAGRLPTLARLASAGHLTQSVSVFPSITPAATASIATGAYPADHGISGAYWWNKQTNQVAYFGSDPWVILQEGPGAFFRDFMVGLNEQYLHAPTVFETVESQQKSAAVINFMWFRGRTPHKVNAPLLIDLLSEGDIPDIVHGPTHLHLGDFVSSSAMQQGSQPPTTGGLAKRYGFHDDCSSDVMQRLFAGPTASWPDFTLAYFPNNDFVSHNVGPAEAVSTVEEVDTHIATLFRQMGGIDRFLERFCIVICGDHSQSQTWPKQQKREICLHDRLGSFRQVPTGQSWSDEDQILICPNLRAAQIYHHPDLPTRRQRHLVSDLLAEDGVDQVFLRHPNEFEVLTSDRGTCRFRQSTKGCVIDDYNNTWDITGSPAAVDASIENGKLTYGDYPNALERIAGGFCDQSASLWVTARPGHEFRVAETHTSTGGSHGSLHRLDSISPLFVAGLPLGVSMPQNVRTVDIAPLCHRVLGTG